MKKLFLLLAILPSIVFGSITATSHIELEHGGSDTVNSAAFDPNVTVKYTDGAVASSANVSGSITFTSASNPFPTGCVNAFLYIKSGSNSVPGWYKITARGSAGSITIDGTTGHGVTAALGPTTTPGCATASSLTSVSFLIDYSQQTSAAYSLTGLGASGSTGLTSSSAFTGDMLGNGVMVTTAASTDLIAATATTTPVITTTSSHNFTGADAGGYLIITAGTNWTAGTYRIVSVSGNAATLDRACGSSATLTSGTGNVQFDMTITVYTSTSAVTVNANMSTFSSATGGIGGALASLGATSQFAVAGNRVWAQYNASAYQATTLVAQIPTGFWVPNTGTSGAAQILLRGYHTYRGDQDGTVPTFQWGVNASSNYLLVGASGVNFENFTLDGNSANYTSTGGINLVTSYLRTVTVENCSATPLNLTSNSAINNFELTGNSASCPISTNFCAVNTGYVHGNTSADVFTISSGNATFKGVLFNGNSGGACIHSTGTASYDVDSCEFYNTTSQPGVSITSTPQKVIISNCYFEANGSYGVNMSAAYNGVVLRDDGFYNNTTAPWTGQTMSGSTLTSSGDVLNKNLIGVQYLSSSGYVNAGSGNFNKNSSAGAGALLQLMGFPATFLGLGTTTSYPDIGATAHQIATATGGAHVIGG